MSSDAEFTMFETLSGLHSKWMPHAGQVPMGKALFYDDCKDIFGKCGRNWGKTEEIAYFGWRYAKENPGTENYIFEPQQKQAREILWSGNRIQTFGPQEWIQAINKTEMRITFKNGSFLKIDGSENYESYRGVKPKGLSVYDEVKDMRKEFFDAYEPNRAAFNTPAVWIGTPPEFPCHYDDIEATIRRDSEARFFWGPSWANPHISLAFILKKFRQYRDSGDIETWLREYAALSIRGGSKHIFPQWLRYTPKTSDEVWSLVSPRHCTLVVSFDPSTMNRFGVLFCLYNELTKKLYLIDEILETKMADMTARKIFERTEPMIKAIMKRGVKDIRWVYDEAAAWFRNELNDVPGCNWSLEPTQKASNTSESGISIIRTLFDLKMIEVSKDLVHFKSDFDGYIKDDKGRLPLKLDEFPDLLRYTVHACGYDLKELEEKIIDPDDMVRAVSMEQDIVEMQNALSYAEFSD